MQATIDLRFTISVDENKTIPLATLAEFVTEQNIESVLTRTDGREPQCRSRRGALWQKNTPPATVIGDSNELAPIRAPLSNRW
jgi:hypothetical protein